ncbi:hypothetical protein [Algoriphagus pacificus]|uniref:Uncharacterized protein n=1 Tax=Algoriphagus pacificus TaxID=2811234 RepID=A0ABS3CKS9_9BACT|nr:hypothetical protein [Algoriphagus pacificus]MBN7817672.1 hypothetical protein [Algoriphagus pacificus]
MTWTDFFLYLALFYVVYYAANVIIDVLRKPRVAGIQEGDAYTFESDLTEFDEKPTVIEDDEPIAPNPANSIANNPNKETEEVDGIEINEVNPVKSSGGVTNIDSLFALAKEGTIEMKKTIVYS